jgi:D-serine/D-alanine/glycine transporter
VYAFFAFLVWALTTQLDTLIALLVTPIWFAILLVAWLVLRRSPLHQARIAAHAEALREEEKVA